MFWAEKNRKKNEKIIGGGEGGGGVGGTSIRYSRVGTKFRLKMTLLKLGIKLTQKGYLRNKKINTIKFYIFKF